MYYTVPLVFCQVCLKNFEKVFVQVSVMGDTLSETAYGDDSRHS
jgi:hypothetical protein